MGKFRETEPTKTIIETQSTVVAGAATRAGGAGGLGVSGHTRSVIRGIKY